jgi:hypothetical protein
MGNSDSLTDPVELRSPLYPPVAVLFSICKGLPCYPVWLPLRVAPDTPGVHLSVLAVIVRIDVSAFLQKSESRQLHLISYEATYRFPSLRPAGLLAPLIETLTGNLVLQVTLYTSLCYMDELPNSHGRTLTGKSHVIHGIRLLDIVLYKEFTDLSSKWERL